jgi:hypothetical protein
MNQQQLYIALQTIAIAVLWLATGMAWYVQMPVAKRPILNTVSRL